MSICSPNYLHDAHIRFGLRIGADVICEKPLVINPWNVEALAAQEQESNQKIYTILQLRHHPSVIALRKEVEANPTKIYDINLTYMTSRGKWYYASWKGDEAKSGGIVANIGIHFFDMLLWIFGAVEENEVHRRTHDSAAGYLALQRARVRWFLSINTEHLPNRDQKVHRAIEVDGKEIDFTQGFVDLHTQSYQAILDGKGFGLDAGKAAIDLVYKIRQMEITQPNPKQHLLATFPLTKHPFA